MDLLQGKDRQALIASFIGVLELLKAQQIRVQQARPLGKRKGVWGNFE